MDRKRIAVIGGGNMGGAIATALSENSGYSVEVYEADREKAEALAAGKAIRLLSSLGEARGADYVLIALKPQVIPSVKDELAALGAGTYISIAAGRTIGWLCDTLSSSSVVRFMPNIAAKVKAAVTAVAFSGGVDGETRKDVMEIASSFGSAFVLEEELFNAFTGISGSAIAFMFDMMHHLALAGTKEGIPYRKALSIASATMKSAAELQGATGDGAIELETMVCSPRGTTIEGVMALNEGGFGLAIADAVDRVVRKSEKMA